jgi:hypothetical protein
MIIDDKRLQLARSNLFRLISTESVALPRAASAAVALRTSAEIEFGRLAGRQAA